MTYTPDELKEIVRYYDDEIKKIVKQIELLPVEKAKKVIRFYEDRGYRIDWEETCFTYENGVKVLHPDYFVVIREIEHKPTTCARFGHRGIEMLALADGSMMIECGYCGHREEIKTNDE
jgi:hypothetical protein